MTARPFLLAMALVAVSAAAAMAQQPAPTPVAAPALADYCATHACRTAKQEIRLRAAGGASFGMMTENYPYVDDDGAIVIYAGEAFAVGFAGGDYSRPEFLRTLSAAYDPALPTPGRPAIVAFELRQLENSPNTQLVMRNETGVALRFEATMYVPSKDGVATVPTSICLLMPGVDNSETWQHPVAMVVLRRLRPAEGVNTAGTVMVSC
jgi:hypothetical protein